MRIWRKKPGVEERLTKLEEKVQTLSEALSSLQRVCIDLTKVVVSSKREIDEVVGYLTSTDQPSDHYEEVDVDHDLEGDDVDSSDRKWTLN